MEMSKGMDIDLIPDSTKSMEICKAHKVVLISHCSRQFKLSSLLILFSISMKIKVVRFRARKVYLPSSLLPPEIPLPVGFCKCLKQHSSRCTRTDTTQMLYLLNIMDRNKTRI